MKREMDNKPAMTEAMREQFEALWASVDRMIVDAWKLGGCEKSLDMLAMRARFDEAANQAALSSPAVVALVEADREYDEAAQAFTNARPYTDEAIAALERVEAVSAKRHAALAALAPFTTGAGHVE